MSPVFGKTGLIKFGARMPSERTVTRRADQKHRATSVSTQLPHSTATCCVTLNVLDVLQDPSTVGSR